MPFLIKTLADPAEHVRWEAAKALSELHDTAATLALVRALEDENSGVQWLAAEGLIAMGQEGVRMVLQALIQHAGSVQLREGAHHVLRAQAEDSLGRIVAPVLEAMESLAPAEAVPGAAYDALKQL